jgi:farnesyl diphosphate synthase
MNPDLAWAVWSRERARRIESFLERALPAEEPSAGRLERAMRYAALGGGKHVRPLLTYAAGELAGANPDAVDARAAAVELIHAYSLVHDDLPCMDDDTLRRGRRPPRGVRRGHRVARRRALQALAFGLLAGIGTAMALPPARC